MSTSDSTLASRKICFVTIGATAAFDSLIRATLSPTFLEVLKQHRYTDLCIQHGEDGRTILQESAKHYTQNGEHHGIKISGFAFNKRGLGAEMRAAKGHNNSDEGVVISHAGRSSLFCCTLSRFSQWSRLWLDTRCPSNRCSTDRGAESGPIGQSPSRASRGASCAWLRRPRTSRVKEVAWYNGETANIVQGLASRHPSIRKSSQNPALLATCQRGSRPIWKRTHWRHGR